MSYSLLNKEEGGAVISVLKKAEDDDALVLRMYNPSETEQLSDGISFTNNVKEWTEVMLDETVKVDAEEVKDGSIGTLTQCQAKTFKAKF